MIRFRVLGGVELHDSTGRPLQSVLVQPKRLALLAWLASASPRGFHRRDTILALFWPELDEERARAALNQAVYHLRRSLGRDAILSRGNDELGVNPAHLWCDVVAFDEAMQDGDAGAALALYRGDLLTGFFLPDAPDWERWLEDERARLRERASAGAWTLAEAAAAAGAATEAATWGRQSVALALGDEPRLRQLVMLLDRMGDRVGALRAYDEAVAQWRDGGLEPSPETVALIERIRSDDGSRSSAASVNPSAGAPGPVSPTANVAAVSPTANVAPVSPPSSVLSPERRAPVSNDHEDDRFVRHMETPPAPSGPAPSRRIAPRHILVGLTAAMLLLLAIVPALRPGSSADTTDHPSTPGSAVASDTTGDSRQRAAGSLRGRTPVETEILRGRYFLSRLDPESYRRAREHFERAIELDPTSARAWSGLAEAFVQLAMGQALASAETYPRARAAAERALELDSTDAAAHASLGAALAMYYWDSDAAEQHFQRSLALDAKAARARRLYAAHLRNLGRFDEALAQIRTAQELDPLFRYGHIEEGLILYVARRYDEALAKFQRYLQVAPEDIHAWAYVALVQTARGRYEEALSALDATDPEGNRPHAQAIRGRVLARMGRVEEARRMLDVLDALERQLRPVTPFHRAAIYLELGEKDRALDLLEQAAEEPGWQMRLLKVEPSFESLAGEPRFQALLQRVDLISPQPAPH